MAASEWSAEDPVKVARFARTREERRERVRSEDRKEAASTAGRGRRRI